jgi:thioredoxin reductase
VTRRRIRRAGVKYVNEPLYDIAVIGAGPAGAQAAISASHQMRHVLVLDGGRVSNRKGRAFWSKSVEFEDVPVFGGITGPRFMRELRRWMEGRPVQEVVIGGERRRTGIEIRGGLVRQLKRDGDILLLEVSTSPVINGQLPELATFAARRVIVASGFEDRWPDIEVDEKAARWHQRYRAVFRYAGNRRGWHVCIRCDGHLHVGQPLAILGVGDYIYQTALGAQDFTDDITILTNGRPCNFSPHVRAQAQERGIRVDERAIRRHIGRGTDLLGFEMADGEELYFHGFFVDEGLEPNTDFLSDWDVRTDEEGLLVVDEDGQVLDRSGAPVAGLYAAGDVVSGGRKLIAAAFAMGQNAALSATDSLRRWQMPQ